MSRPARVLKKNAKGASLNTEICLQSSSSFLVIIVLKIIPFSIFGDYCHGLILFSDQQTGDFCCATRLGDGQTIFRLANCFSMKPNISTLGVHTAALLSDNKFIMAETCSSKQRMPRPGLARNYLFAKFRFRNQFQLDLSRHGACPFDVLSSTGLQDHESMHLFVLIWSILASCSTFVLFRAAAH